VSVHQVKLDDREDSFVREQISLGRYASASEVLRAGLASLEQSVDADAEWRDWLCAEAKIGFDQLDAGQGITLHNEIEIHAFMDEMGKKAKASRNSQQTGR
jgi:putative addiction module CopG family antidote